MIVVHYTTSYYTIHTIIIIIIIIIQNKESKQTKRDVTYYNNGIKGDPIKKTNKQTKRIKQKGQGREAKPSHPYQVEAMGNG